MVVKEKVCFNFFCLNLKLKNLGIEEEQPSSDRGQLGSRGNIYDHGGFGDTAFRDSGGLFIF